MHMCSVEQTEAVRRYYAAFPALKKGEESPLLYYLPPPAWCRRPDEQHRINMQTELSLTQDWNFKNKKHSSRDRRNSYHSQKKNKKRCNGYSRSFESKESLPEWVTYEGIWDMETQNPVKEFIRAIALDEGYGTCENTVTDELKEMSEIKGRMNINYVPDWDNNIDLESESLFADDTNAKVRTPMEEELYAKFEAKFDRSIEALWSKDQNTPDDEYQDLPIDFQDLLSSPSDQMFADPSAEKWSLVSHAGSIWSINAPVVFSSVNKAESPSKIAEVLHDRFKPLNLADSSEPQLPRELESFALYEGQELYDAMSSVGATMRSFTAINHSRDRSGFAEVLPRRSRKPDPPLDTKVERKRTPSGDREDLLTSSRTHFRPIKREAEVEAGRYADGDTFDIRGDLDEVNFRRSESGGLYLENSEDRYLEYRMSKLSFESGDGFRLRFAVRQTDAGVQTDRPDAFWACEECGRSAKKMRPSGMRSIWSEEMGCEACAVPPVEQSVAPLADELSREWEELLSDISAVHAQYVTGETEEALVRDRKRRHSAALRCPESGVNCGHPHARFLHCCGFAHDRPLTR